MCPTTSTRNNKFAYEQLDEETFNILKKKEEIIKNISSDKYFKLGKELSEVRNILIENNCSCFQEWYESLGYKRQSTYNYINYYKLVSTYPDKKDIIEELPKRLTYEIARPTTNNYLRNKVLSKNVTTFKEYKKLKKEKNKQESKYIIDYYKLKIKIDNYEKKLKKFEEKIIEIQKDDGPYITDINNTTNPAIIYSLLSPSWCNLFKSYIDVYRCNNKSKRISDSRHFKLLKEIYEIYKSKRFTFNGSTYSLTETILKEGLEIIINRGIDNLNYAKKVCITKIEKKKKESENNEFPDIRDNEEEILKWMEEVKYNDEFSQ